MIALISIGHIMPQSRFSFFETSHTVIALHLVQVNIPMLFDLLHRQTGLFINLQQNHVIGLTELEDQIKKSVVCDPVDPSLKKYYGIDGNNGIAIK